jgi:hypothetical protein
VRHTSPFKEIWFDRDGSLTGTANASVTYARDFNKWTECHVDTTGTLDFGIWCDSSVRIRRMQFDKVDPQEFDFLYIAATQSSGEGEISPIPVGQAPGRATVPFRPKEIYGWVMPMVTSHFYDLTFVRRNRHKGTCAECGLHRWVGCLAHGSSFLLWLFLFHCPFR